MHWIKSLFRGETQKYLKFIKEESTPGIFIDNFGISVVATADYLDVAYHLVGTSNNDQDPVTKLCDECPNRKLFHVGYFQDTSDRADLPRRLGHYQSLEIVPNSQVPCCGISGTEDCVDIVDEAVEKVKSEEKILRAFLDDK